MSNYNGQAINPRTSTLEKASFLDDYFGKHQYGVLFADGGVYPAEEIEQDIEAEYERTKPWVKE